MRIWMLAAGAAALAITAPALADPKGGGHGGGKGNSSQVERGGGKAKAIRAEGNRGGQVKAERGNPRGAFRFAQSENRGGKAKAEHANRIRGNDDAVRVLRADRGKDVRALGDDRIKGHGKDRVAVIDGDRVFRVRDVNRGVVRFRDVDRDDLFVRRLGWGDAGCPPGLAKKAVRCMPPGQAAKLVGQPLAAAARLAALDPLPRSLRSLYFDDDDYYYRYGGGYLYRVDRDDDLISSMIPLFGAALLGQPLQSSFISPYRPSYFNAFYPNSPYDCYQNGYGYVYETDCLTGMVENVIPTYDYGYGVGQLLPSSYGYYNVPYAYRSSFFDTDDYYYRYAPGAIYQVDRSTSLISAVAALLTGGLGVGQPLPIGYSTYNVPLAYRTSYFDTPDMWYRYDNGYIYSVDPKTQLVTAIVRALV